MEGLTPRGCWHRYDRCAMAKPFDARYLAQNVPEGTARMDDPLFVELTKVYLQSC